MKCRILFSGKSEKNIINLSSAEYAQDFKMILELRYEKAGHIMYASREGKDFCACRRPCFLVLLLIR